MSEDIIVVGRRLPSDSAPNIYVGYVPDGTADNGVTTRPSFNNVSSGGGFSPQAIVYVPYGKKCPTKEASADSIKDAIKALSSGDNYEYSSTIVERSPGVFSSSGQTLVTARSVNSAPVVSMLEDIPLLRGVVHNHPKTTINSANQRLVNRYPSNEDYDGVADIAATYPQFDASSFVIYIVDEDWNVRAFPYSDRANVPTDSADRVAGVGLPDPLPEGSGCQ